MNRKALFVIGGTGLGKTRLGVQLALALNGEVVNSDAMQMYRGLPIATAQPTMEERRGVEHHLMGILGVNDSWTVRDYRDSALKVMEDIWSRGKVPIIVGGTLYYVQSLIWKSLLDEQPGFENDSMTPGEYIKRMKCSGASDTASLNNPDDKESPYEKLKRLDPNRAAQLHPNDTRKIERSLQVIMETGKSHLEGNYQAKVEDEPRFDCAILWLNCNNAEELERRLRARIENMLEVGLIDEAEKFLQEHITNDGEHKSGVYQAIGFRELQGVIEDRASEVKRKQCIEDLVIKHRQYVKSQLKWIKNRILTRKIPVYCLDAANAEKWEDLVWAPALDISQRYLRGDQIDFPTSNNKVTEKRDTKTTRVCEICYNKVLVGDEQWEKHTNGRPHKKNKERVRREEKRKQEMETAASESKEETSKLDSEKEVA